MAHRAHRFLSIAISTALIASQTVVAPSAYADEVQAESVASAAIELSSVQAEPADQATSYEVDQQIIVENSTLYYRVLSVDDRTVAIGNNTDTAGNGLTEAEWPADHKLTIPATVTDAEGTVWTVKEVSKNAFNSSTAGDAYLSSVTILANLDYIGSYSFRQHSTAGLSLDFGSGETQGSAKTVEASAFNFTVGDFEYPEGALIQSSDALKGAGPQVLSVGYPLSSYNEIFASYTKLQAMYIRSPYATLSTNSITQSSQTTTYHYFWADSATETSFPTMQAYRKYPLSYGRVMAVLSEESYTPDAAKPSAETETYVGKQNTVISGIKDGGKYVELPQEEIVCSDEQYGWTLSEGVDYTAQYYDENGTKLDEAPQQEGTYQVEYVGNGKTSWGVSKRYTFTIGNNIAGAEVTHGQDDVLFVYDAQSHAPDIDVSIEGTLLQIGNQYAVTYVGKDVNYFSEEAPTLPGTYEALVRASSSTVGGMLGQVSFEIVKVDLDGGTLEAANTEATGDAVAPEITVRTSGGAVVSPDAYQVTYSDAQGNPVNADDLKEEGTYTATVVGDGLGCIGSLTTTFCIVEQGKVLANVVQNGDVVYTGDTITPDLSVTDKNGDVVSVENYKVDFYRTVESANVDGDAVYDRGDPVDPADLKDVGRYLAVVSATGTSYAGNAQCTFTVIARDATDQAEVTIDRASYDYIPSQYWLDPDTPVSVESQIVYRGEYITPEITVKVDGATLEEDVDYVIECEGNTGSDESTTTGPVATEYTATFKVVLQGNYSGTLSSPDYKYTISKRAHVYEYKGVKYTYAIQNDGTAVITGLDLALGFDTKDFSSAYTSSWDNTTITVPAQVSDGAATYQVVRVAANAFNLPAKSRSSTGSDRDIFNGAKKLVIEPGVVEIGTNAFTCLNIEELELPEGLVTIHAGAFSRTEKIKKIEIPTTVVTMGSAAFGHNQDKSALEKIVFKQPSSFRSVDEGRVQATTSGDGTNTMSIWYGYLFDGGSRPQTDSEKGYSPLTAIALPASYQYLDQIFYEFNNMTDLYYMADAVKSMETTNGTTYYLSAGGISEGRTTLWGWDVKNTVLPTVIAKNSAFKDFQPFAVLGDSYTYENAWNEETQCCDGEATYNGNVKVGTPAVTNQGDSVTVNWDLQYSWVNQTDRTLAEGTDFTVKYMKEGTDTQLDAITEPGTYTATLTGNGVNCFGTTEATVVVDGMVLTADEVSVASDGSTYTGQALEPAVSVTLPGSTVPLEEDTDYTVSYRNNVSAGTATVTVQGAGLYAGTVEKTFAIAKAPLAVKANDAFKTAGNADPALTCTVEGLVGGDVARGYQTSRVSGEDPGTYAITADGCWIVSPDGSYASGNYEVVYTPGTFLIEASGTGWTRLAGATALDTMSAIVGSEDGFSETGGTVVIATSGGYWDALTAAGLAGLEDAPVLMTDGSALSSQTADELDRLKPSKVYVCGGTSSVSDATLDEIADQTGVEPVRVAGDAASGTACAIYEEVEGWSDTCIIATTSTFQDALSIAPYSYAMHAPIFLTESDGTLSAETQAAIEAGGFANAQIVGGVASVSADVEGQLSEAGVAAVDRLAGETALDTSAAIATWEMDNGMSAQGMGVATVSSYYDALCGAALCGKNNAVLVLVGEAQTGAADATIDASTQAITSGYLFGGPSAVSSAVFEHLIEKIK